DEVRLERCRRFHRRDRERLVSQLVVQDSQLDFQRRRGARQARAQRDEPLAGLREAAQGFLGLRRGEGGLVVLRGGALDGGERLGGAALREQAARGDDDVCGG